MKSESASSMSCSLTPKQLAVRRQELIFGLFTRAKEVSDVPSGLRFPFANEPGLLSALDRVMEQAQDCCSFLYFDLTTQPNAGAITFDVLGPPGTVELLRRLGFSARAP